MREKIFAVLMGGENDRELAEMVTAEIDEIEKIMDEEFLMQRASGIDAGPSAPIGEASRPCVI